MSIQGLMFRACSLVGYGYKSPICSRFLTPLYQQTVGVKSVESKLGLPEKPKKPLSPFFRYVQTMRPKLMEENPNLKITEVIKKLSQDWKVCDPVLKKQYLEENQKSAQEYGAALEKYHLSLSKDDYERICEAKLKAKEAKEARALKKKLKELKKPKRPGNAFIIFVEMETAKGSFKGLTNRERLRKAGELWKSAPTNIVAECKEKSRGAHIQYKADLEAWEERMVAEGYVDVVYEPKPKKQKA